MPTREECLGRRLKFCDACEDPVPTPLWPLRYRLGFLVALCHPNLSNQGNVLQLESNA
jgi:hypothetical protein